MATKRDPKVAKITEKLLNNLVNNYGKDTIRHAVRRWDRTITERTKLEKQKRVLERQLEELNKKK